MLATAKARSRVGRVWHFDPGGEAMPSSDATITKVRWSPLASVHDWDSARRISSQMAESSRRGANASGNEGYDHFINRARDWIEVLLFTAHLGKKSMSDVADWASSAVSDETLQEVGTELTLASDRGNAEAKIAKRQFDGLATLDPRERGSIVSTMSTLLRVYSGVAARESATNVNFDPNKFVNSTDVLYITAPPDRQREYAPLLGSLLEEIRLATYARHRASEMSNSRMAPVTFCLDEANNTAPIPLPAIVSEAGGQSLHVVVGFQDLSRARARWGREADGFLTLFTLKVVMSGIVEPYTLNALSDASGDYFGVAVSHTESGTRAKLREHDSTSSSTTHSVQRYRTLTQGDIAKIPEGQALLWEGASWSLIRLGRSWEHPVWRRILA